MRFLIFTSLLWIGCDGGEPVASDASVDGIGIADGGGCGHRRPFAELHFSHETLGVTVGVTRDAYVELQRDCRDGAEVLLRAETDGIVDFPRSVRIPAGSARATFQVVGIGLGQTRLFAEMPQGAEASAAGTMEVATISSDLPACGSEQADGMVSPGTELKVVGGAIAGAGLSVAPGAAEDNAYRVAPFEASVRCHDSIAPEGFRALGPAINFARFVDGMVADTSLPREIDLSVPMRLALLPDRAHRGHVELAYQGPNDPEGRIIAMVSPRFLGRAEEGVLFFQSSRLGIFQAVVRDTPRTEIERPMEYRGITGFSMGGSGSSRIGLAHPDRFDVVSPLGGPTDWIYLLENIRRYYLGGFCTEEQRRATPTECERADVARTPQPRWIHENRQHFEHWWYPDGFDGQGGTFNRDDYIRIFRDLTMMYGNVNTTHSLEAGAPNVTPPGVDDARRSLSRRERCGNPVVLENFFDDEYNPEGTYPVITFCDGGETGDIGEWNPEAVQDDPVEITLAVDINRNGLRDPGEPVIRNIREHFDDFGLDGIPSELEAGYHPIFNPDPSGDDFHFQFNPAGTENNLLRDTVDGDACRRRAVDAGVQGEAERFDDFGIDGLDNTPQLSDGGYDLGEGNGCFDLTAGAQNMHANSPRMRVAAMDSMLLERMTYFSDGGIRDLFNWVVMGNLSLAGFANRGLPTRYYNTYRSLHVNERDREAAFDGTEVPWAHVGARAMVRYGDIDALQVDQELGDGGHVGTGNQVIHRFFGALWSMNNAWPGGDRRVVRDVFCTSVGPACPRANGFVLDFESSDGITRPSTIVLPPGYFDEDSADVDYPVAVFMHGYGMGAEDLLPTGLLIWNAMMDATVGSERRMQKMILIFPEGGCQRGECLKGSFYANAPESTPDGGQVETYVLELMDYVDQNYRTRDAEMIRVLQ